MIESNHSDIPLLQFSNMPAENLLHFSTTIQGGVSEGNFASLNLGNFSDDNHDHINENRRRLLQAVNLSPSSFFVPFQVHGANVLVIDSDFTNECSEKQAQLLNGVDALITNKKAICIGVVTADCVPILLYDTNKHVLATIHAGWRGTVAHIVEKTIAKMELHFTCSAKDMLAGIGPSISPACFEVGDEVGDAFRANGYDLGPISFRNAKTKKLHINLWEANRLQLIKLGVPAKNIEVAELCTFSNPTRFFSARRQTIHTGRMVTGGYLL